MINKVKEGSVALVAFGGNAFTVDGSYAVEDAREAASRMCANLLLVIEKGYDLIVTHGNGPQVGNLLIQRDITAGTVPSMPLDVLVAQTEGALGYILQEELLNHLRAHRTGKYVVTMITQVLVNGEDPAFNNPTKPVGPFYSQEDAEQVQSEHPEWVMVEDAGRGYRRVVPSPVPERVLQSRMIRSLVYSGSVVIACGGGGIPIVKDEKGKYAGVEAVIDKDLTSAVLSNDVKADVFVLLTGVDKVYLNFGSEKQEGLSNLTYSQAKQFLRDGHFPDGSMGPKISAALQYLENGGRKVIITNAESLEDALNGKNGTHMVWA